VVLGLLLVAAPADIDALVGTYASIPPDLRFTVRSNLTLLSLLDRREGMPDPGPHRGRIAELLARLEGVKERR
jgi:hypothetical protein